MDEKLTGGLFVALSRGTHAEGRLFKRGLKLDGCLKCTLATRLE